MTDNIMDEIERINNIKRMKNKKKLHSLLDKYGSLENFRQNSTMVEDFEYQFAQGDSIIDEVEQERQAMSGLPKTSGSSLDDTDMAKNANSLQPKKGTSIFDIDDELLSPVMYLAKYPNLPSPPHEFFMRKYKKYADNQFTQTMSDASVGNRDTLSDINGEYVASNGFDDIYYSKLDESGRVIYKGTKENEGEFSYRKNDLGGKTNYGITQFSLDEYNSWKNPLKKGKNFPIDVKELKSLQAKQILDEMYYQRYGINKITNMIIARNVFDSEINQGTLAGKYLSQSINEIKGMSLPLNKIISQNLADIVNNLSFDDIIKLNDLFTIKRMDRYFESVDKKSIQNINNLRGWYNRAIGYYSNPEVFEKLYKDKVDYYIKKKYPHYYNGE